MKKAVLVLGDGSTHELEGEFLLLTPSGARGVMNLSVIDWYRDCAKVDDLVCSTLTEALTAIEERAKRHRRRRK